MTEEQDNKPLEDDKPEAEPAAGSSETPSQEPKPVDVEAEKPASEELSSEDNPEQGQCCGSGCGREQEQERPRRTTKKGGNKSSNKPDKYRKHILCRYGKMGNIGYFAHDIEDFPDDATHVIVNTERGLEIAKIVGHETSHHKGNCSVKESQIMQYAKASCDNFPLDRKGSVVRAANEQDVREQQHLDEGIAKELSYCETLINQQGLEMTLVDAERLFGGERIIFYFMAEGRVDFRQLVKELAQQYQTRIEMRQVGARDEARLVADFETCGRECCCRSFLKVLYPVNMRMAKLQKATLDPSKISGRCGRLKCCLRFEDEVYQEHKKKLPKKNTMVLTPEGPGKVVDTQVLTLLVKVYLNAGKMIALPLDEILEFNYVVPAEPEGGAAEAEGRQEKGGRPRRRQSQSQRSQSGKKGDNDQAAKPEKAKSEEPANNNGGGESADGGEGSPDKKKKRRRRRRRKKKPSDNQNGEKSGGNDNNSGGGESAGE